MNRWARYALALGLLLFAAVRLATVYTDNVNWDEFALLKNSAATSATGVLHSGGRPGLAVMVLLPFAAGCEDESEVVRRARLLSWASPSRRSSGWAFCARTRARSRAGAGAGSAS